MRENLIPFKAKFQVQTQPSNTRNKLTHCAEDVLFYLCL